MTKSRPVRPSLDKIYWIHNELNMKDCEKSGRNEKSQTKEGEVVVDHLKERKYESDQNNEGKEKAADDKPPTVTDNVHENFAYIVGERTRRGRVVKIKATPYSLYADTAEVSSKESGCTKRRCPVRANTGRYCAAFLLWATMMTVSIFAITCEGYGYVTGYWMTKQFFILLFPALALSFEKLPNIPDDKIGIFTVIFLSLYSLWHAAPILLYGYVDHNGRRVMLAVDMFLIIVYSMSCIIIGRKTCCCCKTNEI